MPRKARLDAPGTLHHVMIRGTEGQSIFREDSDRQNFLFRVGEISADTKTRILAWALMDTHVHILMFSGPQGLSRFMHRLLTGYAVWYNRRYRRSGHLFQNRYKSIVCQEEAYLLELVRYIHLNPLRAGIVKDLEGLDRYPWSGHGVLIGRGKVDWQEREYILRQFADRVSRATRAYRRFMGEGITQGRRNDLTGGGMVGSVGGWSQVLPLRGKKGEHDARILGEEDFVVRILKEAEGKLRRQFRLGGKKELIDQVIDRVCTEEGIEEKELRNGGKRKRVSAVRAKISFQLSQEMGIPFAEIARHVGVCTSAVAKAVQTFESPGEKWKDSTMSP